MSQTLTPTKTCRTCNGKGTWPNGYPCGACQSTGKSLVFDSNTDHDCPACGRHINYLRDMLDDDKNIIECPHCDTKLHIGVEVLLSLNLTDPDDPTE